MKRIWCYLFVFCLIIPAKAQLTLESCQEKSRDNYPLIRQYALIEKSRDYNLANVQKGNLPQISLQGKNGRGLPHRPEDAAHRGR